MRKQSTQGYFSPANYRFANLIWLLLSLLVIAVDQYTKWLAVTNLNYAQPVPVLPFLNWTLLHKTSHEINVRQKWALTCCTCVGGYLYPHTPYHKYNRTNPMIASSHENLKLI